MPIFRRKPTGIEGTPPKPYKRRLRREINRLLEAQSCHVGYRTGDTHNAVVLAQMAVTQELDKVFAYIDALEERINGNVGE